MANKDYERQLQMIKIRSKCVTELIHRHQEEFDDIYDNALREVGIVRQGNGTNRGPRLMTPAIRKVIDSLYDEGKTTTQIQIKLAIDYSVEISVSTINKYLRGESYNDTSN